MEAVVTLQQLSVHKEAVAPDLAFAGTDMDAQTIMIKIAFFLKRAKRT